MACWVIAPMKIPISALAPQGFGNLPAESYHPAAYLRHAVGRPVEEPCYPRIDTAAYPRRAISAQIAPYRFVPAPGYGANEGQTVGPDFNSISVGLFRRIKTYEVSRTGSHAFNVSIQEI